MTVITLRITDRVLKNFTASRRSEQIEISGTYEVTLKNSGFLPVPSTVYNLNQLAIPNTDVKLLSDKKREIGRIARQTSKKVSIDFSATGNVSSIEQFAQAGCNNESVTISVKEDASGLLLARSISSNQQAIVVSESCSL